MLVYEKQYARYFEMEITGKLQEDTESAACTHNIDAKQVMGAFGANKQTTPNATNVLHFAAIEINFSASLLVGKTTSTD